MSHFSIGIDLGTTNSAVAYLDGSGMPRIVKNELASPITPSAVFLGSPAEVGQPAKNMASFETESVAQFFKRDMGNPSFRLAVNGVDYSAQDLSTFVLRYLREQAEAEIGELGETIVTVPAYFNNAQRQETLQAALDAGLRATRTINEPTAAAIAYGHAHPELSGKFLVYDLGGGTFDVTIVEYAPDRNQVLSSEGNHELGGVIWDSRLMALVAERFMREKGIDPLEDPQALGDLRLRCEEAKKALSARDIVRIPVSVGNARATIEVGREDFEARSSDLLDQTRVLCKKALDAAGLMWPSIDAVLLVGGSTRMPAVKNLLRTLTRREPLADINPDECVAIGAALAHAESHAMPGLAPKRKTVDVTPHGLGYVAISPDGKQFINDLILPKNLAIPCSRANRASLKVRPGESFEMDVFLLQGENRRVLDNFVLGHYVVEGQAGSQEKEVPLTVGFEYDVSGMVVVNCANAKTGARYAASLRDREVDLSWTDLSPEEYFRRIAMCAVLCIDTSGSMSGRPLEEAKNAAKQFLKSAPERLPVGVVSFGDNGVTKVCDIVDDHRRVQSAVQGMSAGGGTPMREGLELSGGMMDRRDGNRVLVVLTDGMPADPSGCLRVGDRLKASGIIINAIGTTGADEDFLRKLASDPTRGRVVKDGQVAGAFDRIAKAMSTQASGIVGLQK